MFKYFHKLLKNLIHQNRNNSNAKNQVGDDRKKGNEKAGEPIKKEDDRAEGEEINHMYNIDDQAEQEEELEDDREEGESIKKKKN